MSQVISVHTVIGHRKKNGCPSLNKPFGLCRVLAMVKAPPPYAVLFSSMAAHALGVQEPTPMERLGVYTARDIDDLTWAKLKPRKSFGFKTPAEAFLEKPQVLHLICESSVFPLVHNIIWDEER